MTGYARRGFVAALAVSLSGSAFAGFVELDGDWRASWDDSLDGLVDINSLGTTGDALFIQKSAEFMSLASIAITFEATGPNPSSFIVIDDEILFNNSGSDWNAFRMGLTGTDVAFRPDLTLASGGSGPIGFTIDPFTDAAFTPDNQTLDISGGPGIANGSFWFPGDGVTNGQLWIEIQDVQQGSSFTLGETGIPAPGVLSLLAVIGLAGSRRRRA